MRNAKRLAMTAMLLLALMGCGARERIVAVSAPVDWRAGEVLRGTSVTMPVPPVIRRAAVVKTPERIPAPVPIPTPVAAPKQQVRPIKKAEVQPPAKPAPAAAPIEKTAGWVVQLGALDTPATAHSSWKAVVGKHTMLKDRPLVQTRAMAKGRTVYRIAAGGFASADEARTVCDALKADGARCFIRG